MSYQDSPFAHDSPAIDFVNPFHMADSNSKTNGEGQFEAVMRQISGLNNERLRVKEDVLKLKQMVLGNIVNLQETFQSMMEAKDHEIQQLRSHIGMQDVKIKNLQTINASHKKQDEVV